MSIVQFAEKVLRVELTYYQKELLTMLSTKPKGYIRDVVGKKSSQAVRTVVDIYARYCNESLVSA